MSGRTVTLAVTGPTAAGKSRLCAALAGRGAVVLDADRIAHGVLDAPAVQPQVVAAFGDDILGADGRIDRGVLGPRVFADPAHRERLDAIVHPALAAVCDELIAAAVAEAPPAVVLEAAVYFRLPGPPRVDITVTVTAPAEVRLARLVESGLDPARARERMAAQAHLEPLWRRADRIIVNDGSESTLDSAADRLWREAVTPGIREG
jgi:dephospho-CoA kinase